MWVCAYIPKCTPVRECMRQGVIGISSEEACLRLWGYHLHSELISLRFRRSSLQPCQSTTDQSGLLVHLLRPALPSQNSPVGETQPVTWKRRVIWLTTQIYLRCTSVWEFDDVLLHAEQLCYWPHPLWYIFMANSPASQGTLHDAWIGCLRILTEYFQECQQIHTLQLPFKPICSY